MTDFASVEELADAIGRGEMVIIVDDADRENEGDLILAAEKVTTEKIGFMLRHTSGIICVSMLGERLDELKLPMMVARNTAEYRTAFTVSVDAAEVSRPASRPPTGPARSRSWSTPKPLPPISPAPGTSTRCVTSPEASSSAGHTEAAVDLARTAGLYRRGARRVMNDDGTVARLAELQEFAEGTGSSSARSPTSSPTGGRRNGSSSGWSKRGSPRSTASSGPSGTSPSSTTGTTWRS